MGGERADKGASAIDGVRLSELLASPEESLGRAREALDRINADIAAGRACATADLDTVKRFGDEMRGLIEDIGPLETEVNSLAEVRELANELRLAARNARQEELAEALGQLAAMPVDASGGLLEASRRHAAELLEPGALASEDNVRRAEGLACLVELNRADSDADRARLTAEAKEQLPAECLPALGLAHSGAIEFAPAGEVNPVKEEHEVIGQGFGHEDSGAEQGVGPAESESETLAAEVVAEVELGDGPDSGQSTTAPDASTTSSPSDAKVIAAISDLLIENRVGLAYWIAVAWHGEDGFSTALKALFIARGMKSTVGEFAGRMGELVEETDWDSLRGNQAAQLAAMVAGLRGTLVAPFSAAPSLIEATDVAFAEKPQLKALVDAIKTTAQRGVSPADVIDRVQDIATAEDNLEAVRNRARQMLGLQTIKYQRASNVWRRWIDPEGWLGELLSAVAENRTGELEKMSAELLELRSPKALERRLEDTDRKLKPGSRATPIIARARYKLLERGEDGLEIVADWIDVSKALNQSRDRAAESNHHRDVLEKLRRAAQDAREEVASCWAEWAGVADLRGAVARGTKETIDEVLQLIIEGTVPRGEERPADELFGMDLLRVDGLALDGRFEPLGDLDLDALCATVRGSDWEAAFRRRIDERNFGIAARIVAIIRSADPGKAERMEAERVDKLADERQYLRGRIEQLAQDLEAARRKGQISEGDWLALNIELNTGWLDESNEDLRNVEGEIAELRGGLEASIAAGIVDARQEFETRINESDAFAPYRQRFGELLKRGEISTLEELVLTVERGREPPSQAVALFKQFSEFFPTLVEDRQAKQRDDTEALVLASEQGGSVGALDYSKLKDEEVGDTTTSLEAWRRLSGPGDRDLEEDLATVLDYIGLRVKDGVQLRSSGNEARRKIATAEFGAAPVGKAMIPHFGSGAHGRYRVVAIRDRMTDDAIVTQLAEEPGEAPIILLYLAATLTATARRGIAEQLRHKKVSRAIAVIDDAAFLYLTSKGGHRLKTTMRISMPFTAVNPYTPFVAGSVPVEMFYGRRTELDNITDPEGTSFIYGGRRLGKSALLRAAERRHEERSLSNRAIYLDLKSEGIGEWRTADAIIDLIARGLAEVNVMTPSSAKSATFEEMREQILAWLSTDEDRRILLLLDECDSFLNADADADFQNVSKLKALMESTERRFKPVFAGLHQVRRFERIPNQPLAHLGQPLPIGPLDPQRAYDLITKPMEALGYRFESEELPARILTATNYQPSLIQLFCSELVEHMLTKARAPNTPPYSVSDLDLERVSQTPHVTDEMRSRFELTINLDPRYRVVAYAVAHHALEQGVTDGLDPGELRDICDEYWSVGFRDTGTDEFLALLEEMDSLGVLFKDGRRFFMRSPNVLRMLGTAEQIEDQLLGSTELELPQGFEADSFRDSWQENPDKRRPLTHQQVAGLLERRGQVKVIVGSEATAVEDVMPSLDELFGKEAARYTFVDATEEKPKRLLTRLRKPAKSKHRVVALRCADARQHEIVNLVRQAEVAISENSAPTTAIFVLNTNSLAAWPELVAPDDPDEPTFDIIELRRWTRAGLRAWAHSSENDLPFYEDKHLAQLLKLTGGWPILVERIVTTYTGAKQRKWSAAIAELEDWLSKDGAVELCQATGLTSDVGLMTAWEIFYEYEEPMARGDFQELADGKVPSRAIDVLRTLGLLGTNDEGLFVGEPTVMRAWKAARSTLQDARE